MNEVQVHLLVPGFIKRHQEAILEARSSSTLVRCPDHLLVVDTSTPTNRPRILRALEDLGIEPREVDLVINTHCHYDHTSNNDLFPLAQKIVHEEERLAGSKKVREGELCSHVFLMHTPGHSPGSLSVLVKAEKRYVIAGDALPTKENYLRWVPPGLNYDSELALRSMRRIVENADIVVPGHGEPFQIDHSFMVSLGR